MSDRSSSVARVQFLGAQRIDIGNEVVTPEAERLFGMLVRLSVPLGRITSRQTMMDTLWPGSDDANARHNLRQTVYKARESGLIVESGEDGLRLDPRHWSCDWEDPIGDVPGEWLPNYHAEFSEELSAWVTAQRVGVHGMIRPRIIRALQTARSAGELVLADRYAIQLLDIDTLNEEATLTRAELMAMQGAKVDALRLLDAYLEEIGRVGAGHDAALPAQLLRRRIAEKLPAITYQSAGMHHGPLVGRHRESKRLVAALFDARAGRGGAMLVQGPDGSGKSRLLFEMKKSACLQGMRVVEAATAATPSVVPFTAMRGLVARLLEQPGALGISPESLAVLRAWLASEEFAPDDCPSFEIEDLLASVSEETPLMLLYEHADRMDAESLGQLDRVYRRGVGRHHLLILTSATHATPTEAPVELQWIERVSLRPMNAVDVRSIVTAWAAAELPRAKQDQIACAAVFAEGVPMYGIEMLGLMLDSGSPDVIPWRVQVAVDRAMRELSELQWRILALCGLLGASARQSVVAAALKVGEMELANALDGLETFGYVQCEEGVLRASGLMADAANKVVKASITRLDCVNAAGVVENEWAATQSLHAFCACLRLRIEASDELAARRFLDTEVGKLVRAEPAPTLVFELRNIRAVARSSALCMLIDATVRQFLEASENKRPDHRERERRERPASLPDVSPTAIENAYTLATATSLLQSQHASRDPTSPAARRLSEAVEAVFVAANTDDGAALEIAFTSVNALRHSREINPFDLRRADLIYFATTGDRPNALLSADALAAEARTVRDVGLACKGLRNSAEAFSSFGFVNRAQELLLESRSLAAKLDYAVSIASADLRLADLCIFSMDTEGAARYLSSAESTLDRHQLRVPVLRADCFFYSCWNAILAGDESAAAKASRGMVRTLRGGGHVGTARSAIASTILATHRGKISGDLHRSFETLQAALLRRTYDSNREYSLAALLLFASQRGDPQAVATFATRELEQLTENGRSPWPFLKKLLIP